MPGRPPTRTAWAWLVAALWAVAAVAPCPAAIRISEFMAENDSGLTDVDGDRPDWIELENTGSAPVSLDGWFLTDNATDLNKWRLPAVTLAPGAQTLIFASGKDRAVVGTELHTNFSLSNAGEFLALVAPDGVTVVSSFAPAFPPQKADVSYGIARAVTEEKAIAATSAGRFLVPTSGALGSSWIAPGFVDSSWTTVQAAVGYQVASGATVGLPQAYWPFDDALTDFVGGGPAFTLDGSGFQAAFPTVIGSGKSLVFNGAESEYGTTTIDVSESAYTASFWFKTSNANAGLLCVVDSDLGGGGHDRHVFLSGGNIRARTWNNEVITSTGKVYANNQWHHVAHVYGGSVGGQKLFVDGVLVATGTKAFSDFNWQKRVNIGFSNDAASPYLTGNLDDLAIWPEALPADKILALAQGVSPLVLGGYTRFIQSPVTMQNVNSTGYLRVPFSLSRPAADYEKLELRVRYDDGFVAWIDGIEVARRQAPTSPAWNSTATGDRPALSAVVPEIIDLTAFRPLIGAGTHVLAVQVLNDAVAGTDLLFSPELVAVDIAEDQERYLLTPSPGAANLPGVLGFVEKPTFSAPHGWQTGPVSLTLTCPTPGASLIYTVNGSAPTATNGTVVLPPSPAGVATVTFTVSSTTVVRAAGFLTGYASSDVVSNSYLMLSQVRSQPAAPAGYPLTWAGSVASDYAVDPNVVNSTLPGYGFEAALQALPVVSISTAHANLWDASAGIYYDSNKRGLAGEKPISLEMIPTAAGAGVDLQIDCGMKLHGNSSRSHGFTPKHPLRLEFRRSYGRSKLKAALFPDSAVDEFDELLFRACSTDSFPVVDGAPRWINDKGTYIRDQYIRDAMRDMGQVAGPGIYVHVFLNGLYWGVYNITERPTDSFCESHLGGAKDDWDVLKDFAELDSGSTTAWTEMMTLAGGGTMGTDAGYQRIQGNNPDGTRNPAYPVYLHMASFIDYMILHIASGAEDWPTHNWWAGRRRTADSDGFHFFEWDQEISNDDLLRTRSVIFPDQPFESVNQANCPAFLYDKLRQGPAFKKRFRERVHELFFNGGVLSPTSARARWAVRQAQLDLPIVAESARWGDRVDNPAIKREGKWLTEMNFMQTPVTGFWDQMFPKQIQRFRTVGLYPSMDQPTIAPAAGVVAAGTQVSLTSPVGTIYYTLDGSDPMGANGTPSVTAQVFQSSVTTTDIVAKNSQWKYLVTSTDAPETWKSGSFDDSAWPQGFGQLGYGDGDEATTIGYGGVANNRYITTYFRKSFTVSDPAALTNVKVSVLRDDGCVVYLNGTELGRSNMPSTNPVNWLTRASTNVAGADESTLYYDFPVPAGAILAGNNVLAVEIHQVSPSNDDVSFDAGMTATVTQVAAPVVLNQTSLIRARVLSAGEWSGLNSARYFIDSVPASSANLTVSEIHYHPADPVRLSESALSADPDDFEFIELMNTSASAVELTGVKFAEGVTFDFTASPIQRLEPGQTVLVVKNAAAFAARYGGGLPVAGEFAGGTGLSNGGETLTLIDRNGATVFSFAFDDVAPWPVTPDGGGPSLVRLPPVSHPDPGAASSWAASFDAGGSPGIAGNALTLAAWQRRFFDPADASDAALSGPSVDADGDGWTNLAEFALGSDPRSGATPEFFAGWAETAGQTFLTVQFSRRPELTGWALEVQSSDGLNGWSAVPTVLLSSEVLADGSVRETRRVDSPVSGVGRMFLRVAVKSVP